MFRHKYYLPLILFWGLFFPVWVPMFFWNECLTYAFYTSMFRYILQLNGTWCINSVAHMFGTKPYDTKTDGSFVSTVQNGAANVATIGSKQNGHAAAKGIETQKEKEYKWEIVWFNVVWYILLHTAGIHGLFLILTGTPEWKTSLWAISMVLICSQGVTAGAHRLWAHKTYKAKVPFRLLLALLQTISMQNSIFIWARDHRVHHKFTDTDADPHNSKRGFFFSHMGWLMVKKHKELMEKGRSVDVSDLKADPVVMFQHKYYYPLALFWGFFFPVWVPMYFWNEGLAYAFYTSMFRYTLQLNGTWCINSVTHMFGTKPYDTTISAVQNKTLGILGGGEGWHNYHHVFPWDYKANEFGDHWMNHSAALIDLMAAIGWAYDLKTTTPEIIRKRCLRTGDGSRKPEDKDFDYRDLVAKSESIWGWDDKDLNEDDRQLVEIHNKAD